MIYLSQRLFWATICFICLDVNAQNVSNIHPFLNAGAGNNIDRYSCLGLAGAIQLFEGGTETDGAKRGHPISGDAATPIAANLLPTFLMSHFVPN